MLLGNPEDLHLNVDPSIRRLTSRLHDYAVQSLHADDFAVGFWPSLKENANDAVLRQQAALRHSPSLLVETPRRGTLSALERVGAHRAVSRAILNMLREQQPELANVTASARRRAVVEGAGGREHYYYASPTRHTDTPPCGYSITEDEYQEVEATLRLHGINATPERGSWKVSTAQASQPLIGLLLDARAPEKVTTAEPVACRPSQ